MTPNITRYRKAYKESNFLITDISLHFFLDPESTIVKSILSVLPTNIESYMNDSLELQGHNLDLLDIRINGKAHTDFVKTEYLLIIKQLPNNGAGGFILEIDTCCNPKENTYLSGLYISNGMLVTHCEPEGFRRITYFLDRPDVMAKYRVTLEGNKALYPTLLSNGNLITQTDLGNGFHQAIWEDPFPKPSYLFALVAGNLCHINKTIYAPNGQKKLLQVWAVQSDIGNTEHALNSLIHAIEWDQKRFGLELDLERFMIVAVADFNFGAMENKGLNLFNSRLILANPNIATDSTYLAIEGIVAHEYFHNWTGNRITCRDWFQLSLKEGLTVFRDQEFSSDRIQSPTGRALRRIRTVNMLRSVQFLEDAGPMAHPVRPESYQTIDNFYTSTVYNKGAELIRMIHALLGEDGFQKGIALYINRHDGQAVTCDDFVAAMADANDYDLNQFKLWYSQAGTPHVRVTEFYDKNTKQYSLHLKQSCATSVGQKNKKPFLIPLLIKLIPKGTEINNLIGQTQFLHQLKAREETLFFENINSKPALSINRQFTAPIIIDLEQSEDDLINQLQNDDDAFNRWEASQKINVNLILQGKLPSACLLRTYRSILTNPEIAPEYRALIFTLPSEGYLAQHLQIIDPIKLTRDRLAFAHILAKEFEYEWLGIYHLMQTTGPYSPEIQAMGKRSLKNLCLSNLLNADCNTYDDLAKMQYELADNLTDRLGSIAPMTLFSTPSAEKCLENFYKENQCADSVVDIWFSLQSLRMPTPTFSILPEIERLSQHPAFSITNPNRVSSLYSAFCYGNSFGFHQVDGSGYDFWSKKVLELDALNPTLAASLARVNLNWKKLIPVHQDLILQNLKRILANSSLSINVREIISKCLG